MTFAWKVAERLCNKNAHRPFISLMESTENKRDGYARALKYTGVFGGVQGLNIIIGLVRSKLVALILGPAGMGLAALLNTIVSFVSQATNLGVSFSAVRHMSEIFESGDGRRIEAFVKTVRAWSAVAAIAGVAVCVAASPLLAGYALGGRGHAWQVAALAPTVAAVALAGGESALLKGARRLRELATAQVVLVVLSLVVAVPAYLLMGVAGIIPVITLTALANLAVTARFSTRLFPVGMKGAWRSLGEGGGMVRLGLAFIMAGVLGSGAEMAVRSFLNTAAGIDVVGLYNAGYILTVTYAGMVFTAMEADYFPRLSAVNHDTAAVNTAVDRQIEVTLLVVSPMLAFIMTAMPWLVPLLYSGKFAPVVGMAQAAVLAMYARAVLLPVTYMTLAKSHSLAYLVTEGLSAAAQVALTVWCYGRWGLSGTGVALLLANVFDMAVMLVYTGVRYGYRPSLRVSAYAVLQFLTGAATYLATFAATTVQRVVFGLLAFTASACLSVYALKKNVGPLGNVFGRLRKR